MHDNKTTTKQQQVPLPLNIPPPPPCVLRAVLQHLSLQLPIADPKLVLRLTEIKEMGRASTLLRLNDDTVEACH